ncbi:MAG TPA: hypothetical protein VIG66_11115 [Noviherbaspirillum sp.]
MRRVIAIAAPVGGGKSSLAGALAQALDNAPILRFDDFQLATRQSIPELQAWLARGADFDALEAPGLTEELARLRGEVAHGGWLVFEMPLGRTYAATANAIDLLVWLDVPLDVALARKLRELAAGANVGSAEDARMALQWMESYLAHYMTTVRKVLEVQRQRVPQQADLVLDGCADVQTLLAQVLERVRAVS